MRRARRPALELRAVGDDGPRRCSTARRRRRPRELPRPVRRRHPRRALGRDGRGAGGAARRARREGRRACWAPRYLFTEEAVAAGAITADFQEEALRAATRCCSRPGPGHATRCLPTPFADAFGAEKRRLRAAGTARGRSCATRSSSSTSAGCASPPRASTATAHAARTRTRPSSSTSARTDQCERGHVHDRPGRRAARRACSTLAELHRDVSPRARRLLERRRSATPRRGGAGPPPSDVAIVGMACFYPGAATCATFWENILASVDADHRGPAGRAGTGGRTTTPTARRRDKIDSKWGGFMPTSRSTRSRSACRRTRSVDRAAAAAAARSAQAALDDAGYADRPFAARADVGRSSAPAAAGDLAVGYAVRSTLPLLLGDAAPRARRTRSASALPEWTEDSFPGILLNVAAGRSRTGSTSAAPNYTVDAACGSSLAAVYAGVARAGDRHERRGHRRRRRRDAERRSPTSASRKTHALSPNGPLPAVRRRGRRHRDQRGRRRASCSSGWPTPSATATASTPSSRASARRATAATAA